VLFSGGKGLRGPQSSGLILGRRDLVQACAFHACPRPFIGRPMKAGKEEIAGLLAALRWTLDQDEAALLRSYEDMVARIIDAFSGDSRVSAVRSFPSEAGQPMPRAELTLKGQDRDELLRRLLAGNPAISLAASGANGVYINPQTLQAGEEDVIVERIKEILAQ
jgi:seryl-tRNA(Sec) selenium transferase